MTKEAIDMISPYLDAANIDLKFFKDETYKKMAGARLQPVLETIKNMKEAGIWIEITTLIIPDVNDSDEELKNISEYIAGIDPYIPWHISRFFPAYKYPDSNPTPIATLERAREIGEKAGLKFVYPGNIDSAVVTRCTSCNKDLITRSVYRVENNLIKDGKCSHCGTEISGVWS